MIIIAHRGGAGLGPENTLAAIGRSLAAGAEWIEVDIHALEQALVVFHDRRLERCTNGSGALLEQRLDALRALDAGEGERIPLLHEVLDAVAGRARLNIELKGAGCVPLLVALLEHYVDYHGWRWEDFLASSFDQRQLLELHHCAPLLPIGLLLTGPTLHWREEATLLAARSLHMASEFVDAALVEAAHAAGLQVLVYTVNHRDELQHMVALGVDGIFTDYPALGAG